MTETDKGLTKEDLLRNFREIGVSEGMELEVHSSLSSFGYVEGGADTVVSALMEAVGKEGAIVMSAFPISKELPLDELDKSRGITCKMRKYPQDHDLPTSMGVISDIFQKRPGVFRGKGEHRVAAWGKDAEEHSKGFTKIIDDGGYALMLGVDIYRLTSMHYMEGELPGEITALYTPPAEILKHYPKEKWFIAVDNHSVKAWYKIQNEADKKGFITWKTIGKSRCMFFKINDVIRLYEKALKDDPLKLYGLR